MKKYALVLAFLFAIIAVWLAVSRHNPTEPSVAQPNAARPKSLGLADEVAQPTSTAKHGKSEEDENAALEAAERAERLRDRQERMEREEREYNTLITFYGVVLDERGRPVAGAIATYTSVDGSFKGDRKLQSDVEGHFTISGIRGKYLDVKVEHPTYYELPESRRSFTYAGNDRRPDFKPNPTKPEIFRLKKKGEAAELVRQSDQVIFNQDEHARSFSLFDHTRRRDRPEYVILQGVETAERDKQGKPIRRLEMVVPEGGIQQRTDPFVFTAPSDGYQSSMYFMRPEFGGILDYFVKFNNGNYARFTIQGSAGHYNIESYLNPDKSPNLEYDPAKEITFVRNGRMGIDLVYPPKDEPPPKKP